MYDITEIELWRDDAGISSDWFCDVIILFDPEAGILFHCENSYVYKKKTSNFKKHMIYQMFAAWVYMCCNIFLLLALIAFSAVQSSVQTHIHSAILVIDTSNNPHTIKFIG